VKDEAHLFLQDIDELWKFVNLGLAKNPSNPGDLRICTECDGAASARGIVHHRAEFVDAERMKFPSHVLLPEEDGV
jgi:hypothetical protein